MSGQNMNISDLEHNNMVPFFGSKITQNSVNRGYIRKIGIHTA